MCEGQYYNSNRGVCEPLPGGQVVASSNLAVPTNTVSSITLITTTFPLHKSTYPL
jgi:hypothetical protein